MLCEKCSNIHFKPLQDCELPLHNFVLAEPDQSAVTETNCVFYFHHDSKASLQASAEKGCHFCGMLYGHIFQIQRSYCYPAHFYSFSYEGVTLRRSIVKNWLAKNNGFQEWNDGDWIYIDFDDKVSLTTTSQACFESENGSMLAALTGCTDISGQPARSSSFLTTGSRIASGDVVRAASKVLLADQSPHLYSPWLDNSTISPASLSLASLWLNNCLHNHNPCTEAHVLCTLPTRVINVSNPQEPRIEDGSGRSDPYVTLSYMWGTRQRFTTTNANEKQHRTKLPLARLPNSFKDAIYFTHMLGFQWLWIDALCIIQDSPEDAEREINAMDNVFRGSTLTLFAAAGDGADAGLGVSRDPRWNKPCLLRLRTTLNGTTAEGSSYITVDCDTPTEPLYTRGWVLQEQVLASRGLMFCSDQLKWRCLCSNSSENNPTYRGKVNSLRELGSSSLNGRRDYTSGIDGFDLLRMWITKADPVPNRTLWQRNIHFDHWYEMISNFSSRVLTYYSDTLPALSGLANAMIKIHHCTYKAGLWLEDLQVGLAWYVVGKHQTSRVSLSVPSADKDHSIQHTVESDRPSWSWISQYRKIARFRRWENNNDHIEHEGVSVTLASQHLQDSKKDTHDGMVPRLLLLTGRVRTAVVVNPSDNYEQRNETLDRLEVLHGASCVRDLVDPKSREVVGQIALDDWEHYDYPSLLVHCLLCTVRKKDEKWQLTCLGLLPTDLTLEEFVRVGLVSIYDSSWFGDLNYHIWFGGPPTRGDTQHVRTVRVI